VVKHNEEVVRKFETTAMSEGDTRTMRWPSTLSPPPTPKRSGSLRVLLRRRDAPMDGVAV
jgi:hypothetical protein